MKRILILVLFSCLGGLVAWFCLQIKISTGGILNHFFKLNACNDIEQCGEKWWSLPLLLFYIFGPSIIYPLCSIYLSHRKADIKQHIKVFSVITSIMVIIYFL